MNKEIKKRLALWLKHDKSQEQNNLIEYLQERICFYANSNDTPAEQIKGMNRLLRDVINMPNEFYEVE